MVVGINSRETAECRISEILQRGRVFDSRRYFKDKSYGPGLNVIYATFTCLERNPKIARRARISKKDKTISVDFNVGLEQMAMANDTEKLSILVDRLWNEIPDIVSKYNLKDFDIHRFTEEFRGWVDGLRSRPLDVLPLPKTGPKLDHGALGKDGFVRLVKQQFFPLAERLGLQLRAVPDNDANEDIQFVDDKRFLAVGLGLLPGHIHSTGVTGSGDNTSIRLLSLKYTEIPADGLAPILFGRPDAFGIAYDLIDRVLLQHPGDLAEAVTAFAEYLSRDPSMVFYGKKLQIIQSNYAHA